jgi:hypothetical protein
MNLGEKYRSRKQFVDWKYMHIDILKEHFSDSTFVLYMNQYGESQIYMLSRYKIDYLNLAGNVQFHGISESSIVN